jgi:excisionase family DNA binding protein
MHNVILSPIATDELIRLISESVTADVLKAVEKQNNEVIDPWLSLNDLIAYDPQQRTRQTFYGLVSVGRIPHYKTGKKLFFLKSEIDEWLKSGKVKTSSEARLNINDYLSKK